MGGSTPTIINCTFVENMSDDLGGAIGVMNNAHPELLNCVLWGDSAPTGNEIRIGHPNLGSGAVTVSYSDVAGGHIDRDGVVGSSDILAILAAWGPYEPCPPAIAEDIDLDCEVAFADLLIVLAEWGSCP